MIQRLQTVFLLLAIVMLGLFLYMPLLRFEIHGFNQEFAGWDVRHYYNGYIWFINPILIGIAIGLTFINIFLYKRRNVQALLCWMAIIFIVAGQFYVIYKYETAVFLGDVILRKWNLFSAAAVVFEILAFVYIRRDEQLVKSMDRLR